MRDDPGRASEGNVASHEMLWLLGQPHLADYLDFVKHEVVGGAALRPQILADEWRAANEVYYELEEAEGGIADGIECSPLDPALDPLVAELMACSAYRNTFDILPMSVEMVELDRLIVSQTFIAGGYSERRAATLGTAPTAQELFRHCLPVERSAPPVTVERSDTGIYRISSPSTDLRFQEPRPFAEAEAALSPSSFGEIAAIIGTIVGFGSNFLTAIRSDTRLLLHNGYHRAWSLRARGITHAPCLVETVTRKDELRIAATDAVSDDPAFYFRAARPPMLRDFFDPRLTRRFQVQPKRTVVEVEIKVRKLSSVQVAK